MISSPTLPQSALPSRREAARSAYTPPIQAAAAALAVPCFSCASRSCFIHIIVISRRFAALELIVPVAIALSLLLPVPQCLYRRAGCRDLSARRGPYALAE